jgi:hypothetical protein
MKNLLWLFGLWAFRPLGRGGAGLYRSIPGHLPAGPRAQSDGLLDAGRAPNLLSGGK